MISGLRNDPLPRAVWAKGGAGLECYGHVTDVVVLQTLNSAIILSGSDHVVGKKWLAVSFERTLNITISYCMVSVQNVSCIIIYST